MKIMDFLDKKAIKLEMASSEKEDALKELVDLLAEVHDIGEKKTVVKALVERESLGRGR